MIIDKILDRYDGDAYDPKEFYDAMMDYEGGMDYPISRALDGGEEEDIRRELCAYIDDAQYNPKIKDFINSVKWLEADDGKDYRKEIDILGESKDKGETSMKKHVCSMQKKKESLAKKQERLGFADNDVRLNGEDLVFVVTGVTTDDRGYDLAVSVKDGETYTLDELGYEISGMCENCNGYPTATCKDYPDDVIQVVINAPVENDDGELTDDYWDAVTVEGYVKVTGKKLDDVTTYLEDAYA